MNITKAIATNISLQANGSFRRCEPNGSSRSANDQAVLVAGYAVLMFFSLFGNAFTLAVFYKRYDQLRTPVNSLIANMAVSDLCVPVFVLPRRILGVYHGWRPWFVGGVMGEILCRVVNLADEVSITVSSQSMVFIAAERFWAIVFPLKKPLISQRTTPKCIAFTWGFSLVFYSYYFAAYKLVDINGTRSCDYGLPRIFATWQDLWKYDRLSLFVVFVVVPFILTSGFYTAIIVKLYRRDGVSHHLSSDAQRRRAAKNKNITLMLIIVVAVFFIAWTPHYVFFFQQNYPLGHMWSCEAMRRLTLAFKYMTYIYTAVNPLVYYTFNSTYRQGFHDLLRCPWPCPHGWLRRTQVEPADSQPSTERPNDLVTSEIELQAVSLK